MKKSLLGLLLLTASCNTPCNLPTSMASLITGAFAAAGNCNQAGAALIQADVSRAVAKLGLCTNKEAFRGTLANLGCGPAISILGSLAGASLDAKYPGCNFTKALVAPETALIALCEQLPF